MKQVLFIYYLFIYYLLNVHTVMTMRQGHSRTAIHERALIAAQQ